MGQLRTVVMVPARMAASRFPGKPLAKILDLPMVEHVRRRALLCPGVDAVYVATCDEEIRAAVESYGGKVIMTSNKHERCTDRIEEASRHVEADVVVNVQGDEPCVFPQCVADVARPIVEGGERLCSCLVYPVARYEELENPNLVKAVLSRSGSILYMSRSVIPSRFKGQPGNLYKQSGIMAYRREFLGRFARMAQTPLERAESVDMLRILENDIRIHGVVVPYETPGVDVPADVAIVERLIQSDRMQKELYERVLRL